MTFEIGLLIWLGTFLSNLISLALGYYIGVHYDDKF